MFYHYPYGQSPQNRNYYQRNTWNQQQPTNLTHHAPHYQPYSHAYYPDFRQNVRGTATWTEGGPVTKCGSEWAINEYMTVAVSTNSPYECGQTLRIKNLSVAPGHEIIATVVDKVVGFPANKINLHKKAFEALGSDPSVGVITVEITPSPELEEYKMGKFLLPVVKVSYPGYEVTDYEFVEKEKLAEDRTKETFDFIIESPEEILRVRANISYNPETERIISIDLNQYEQ